MSFGLVGVTVLLKIGNIGGVFLVSYCVAVFAWVGPGEVAKWVIDTPDSLVATPYSGGFIYFVSHIDKFFSGGIGDVFFESDRAGALCFCAGGS